MNSNPNAALMAPPGTPTHPYLGFGIPLVVIGIILVPVGLEIAAYCTFQFGTTCLQYGDKAAGYQAVTIGVVLVIIGLVLMFLTARTAATSSPTSPSSPPPPTAGTPQVTCTRCGSVFAPGQHRFCPNCGQQLG